MAARDAWWLNRIGSFASQSNPGSAVPNYGLTFDVATQPWDNQAQFNSLVASNIVSKVAGTFLPQNGDPSAAPRPTAPLVGKPQDASLFGGGLSDFGKNISTWDWAKKFAGEVGHGIGQGVKATVGAVDEAGGALGADMTTSGNYKAQQKKADRQGLKGWDRLTFFGGNDLGQTGQSIAKDPVAQKAFWALHKVSEGTATAEVAMTEAQKMHGDWGSLAHLADADVWARAHGIVKKYDLNAGEGFAQMFYDDEMIDDQARFDKIRQHSTVFNASALAFNTIGAWEADPLVLGGKALGGIRAMRAGKLAESGATSVIQRDILAQGDRADAELLARNAGGIANRVRAQRALTLWDKANNLREAAKTMGYEDFKNLKPFQNSASGVVLSKLFQDVAHDDQAWNLVFRTSIGDQTAMPELLARRADVADKIDAIELGQMPRLDAEMTRVGDRMAKRLAEQGRTSDQGLEYTRYSDWFLDQQAQDAKAALDAANAKLAGYQDHESWLTRTTRGMDDSRQSDAVFHTLGTLNPKKGLGQSLHDLGGKVSMFQRDEFSPASKVITAPTKPFLKRVGVVNLNDAEEGAQGVGAYLDQMAYVSRMKDQGARDHVFGRWAGSTTDVQRKQIVDELERQGIALVLRKHGITNDEMLSKVQKVLQGNRADAWGRMSDPARYTTLTDETGKRLDKRIFQYEDSDGSLTKVAMPMDPTELPNWRPLTNLVDLDHALATHKDMFQELNAAHELGVKSRRLTENLYNFVGESLNTLWKPAALISLRWPARVVADESFRVMLALGVMPHMKAWGEGATNALYNTGFVKPYAWVLGRKVPTGQLADETLRTRYDEFDPFDTRAATNPTGAVPVEATDFGKIDPKRADKLGFEVAKRNQYLRKLEAHRGQTREAGKTSPEMADAVSAFTKPERPKWAQQWDDRLNEAKASESRGFFFDPVTRKASNKGFAVSVYPGRLRTFASKPSARDMNWWIENNQDVLAAPSNRVAVWHDKETGRWHLDAVRTHARREDAMRTATKAEAPEFFDVGDGFTRYMKHEDPHGHADGPLLNPQDPAAVNRPAGVGGDQAPIKGAADEAGAAIGDAMKVQTPQKRKLGFGKVKWKSIDGKTVEGEAVYGPDVRNPNIYYSAHSSKGAFQQLYGGYTKGLGVSRLKRSGNGARAFNFPVDEPMSAEAKDWAEAQSWYVNRHLRKSPIWLRMLNGDSDQNILTWLNSSEGRALRRRMPERGATPHRWVQDMRAVFEHTLPTDEARLAAKQGEVSPDMWDRLIPHELKGSVHGDTIQMAEGTHQVQDMWRALLDKTYEVLGSMPTDALVRHPFARNAYNLRMKNYLASLPADEITDEVMNAASASARAFATKQVRRLLYNIADESQGVHMLRFLSPFLQAQVEVLERYAHLFTTKPESMVRTMQMFYLSQNGNPHKGLWYTVDQNGNPTNKFSHQNNVVFQVSPFMRQMVNHIPGLKGALDDAKQMAVPVSSMDLIFQGDTPYLPQMGPLVTMPAQEMYFKDRPFKSQSEVYKWLFPYGMTPGSNMATRVSGGLLPAWGRRMMTALQDNTHDSAFANAANIRYQDLAFEWEKQHGRALPESMIPRFTKQAMDQTKAYWMLRAASSFLSPVPVTARSPQQFYIDQARKYRTKYGLNADQKFYDDFGADYFRFFTESSKSTNGLAPTAAAAKGYLKNKSLIDMAPDLAGVLAGPQAGKGNFDYEVYQWELRTRKGPGSNDTMREVQTPAQRIEQGQVDRGWIEYGKLASAVDVEMRRRGLTSLTSNASADLRTFKAEKVREIIQRNPGWQTAYRTRQDKLSNWLGEANSVIYNKSLDKRTDIQGLRAYMLSRQKVQDVLFQRQANGGSANLSANQNADLGGAWNSYVTELTAKNLLFAEIYHRYLENDDLSVMVTN